MLVNYCITGRVDPKWLRDPEWPLSHSETLSGGTANAVAYSVPKVPGSIPLTTYLICSAHFAGGSGAEVVLPRKGWGVTANQLELYRLRCHYTYGL